MKINQTDDAFAANIKKLREERGLLQKDVIAKLQVLGINTTFYHYSKLEHGKRNIDIDVLFALCQIFECDMNTLFNFEK